MTFDSNGHAAHANGKLVSICPFAGLAYRHDNSAPIGVTSGNRRLDQRRIGHGKPDTPCCGSGFGAADVDRNKLLCPFAITDHLGSQIDAYCTQRFPEILKMGVTDAGNPGVANLAGCGQQKRIARVVENII